MQIKNVTIVVRGQDGSITKGIWDSNAKLQSGDADALKLASSHIKPAAKKKASTKPAKIDQ